MTDTKRFPTMRRAARYAERIGRRRIETARIRPSMKLVSGLTMAPVQSQVNLGRLALSAVRAGIPGNIVECGVWRGGLSFMMADLLRRSGYGDRMVWMFDSFEGLPPPTPVDGIEAVRYAAGDTDVYYDNCTASIEDVTASAQRLALLSRVRMVKGWYEQTLPTHKDEVGAIAVLHVDCDWYESVRLVLDELGPAVSPGGYIVIDDYFTWPGSAVAVHEWLAKRHLPVPIVNIGDDVQGRFGAYFQIPSAAG